MLESIARAHRYDEHGLRHAQPLVFGEHGLPQARRLEVDGGEGDGQQAADGADDGGRGHGSHVVGQLRLHLQCGTQGWALGSAQYL